MYEDQALSHDEPAAAGDAFEDGDGGWEVISSYSRAQALKDGVLVDVSEHTREAGIKLPVAVTSAVWSACVALTPAARRAGNSERGRVWDVVWMLRCAILRHRTESEFLYDLLVVQDSVHPSRVKLKSMCGPGDDGEPVITVLMPEED